jgi:hypothetical protein
MKVIFDIEAPKRCDDCQFCDYEFGFCHLDKDSMHADRACDLVGDTERAENGNCPIKPNGYLAEAAQMVLDFVNECEGTTIRLKTPGGEELDGDWGYVLEGLEEIIGWAKTKESQCRYERQDVQTEENMQLTDLREEQEERLSVAPILNPKTT